MSVQHVLSDVLLKSLDYGGVMDNVSEAARADVKLHIENATATVYFDSTDDARAFMKAVRDEVECTLHLLNPTKDPRIIRVMNTDKLAFKKKRALLFNMLRDGMTVFEFTQAARRLGGDVTDLGFFLVRSIIRLEDPQKAMTAGGGHH